jgi:hypothetical protein
MSNKKTKLVCSLLAVGLTGVCLNAFALDIKKPVDVQEGQYVTCNFTSKLDEVIAKLSNVKANVSTSHILATGFKEGDYVTQEGHVSIPLSILKSSAFQITKFDGATGDRQLIIELNQLPDDLGLTNNSLSCGASADPAGKTIFKSGTSDG